MYQVKPPILPEKLRYRPAYVRTPETQTIPLGEKSKTKVIPAEIQTHKNKKHSDSTRTFSCWNCGSTDNLLNPCPMPKNLPAITFSRLNYYGQRHPGQQSRVLKRVLFELASQIPGDIEPEFADILPSNEQYNELYLENMS